MSLGDALLQIDYFPAWRVAIALCSLHLEGYYEGNTVKLTTVYLKKFRVSRWQKPRALKRLEKASQIIVNYSRKGANPQVTLLWIKP